MAFRDYLDLQTVVVERMQAPQLVQVIDVLTQLAESRFNQVLRTRHQITELPMAFVSGSAAVPGDLLEVIGLYDGNGCEYEGATAQVKGEKCADYRLVMSRVTLDGPTGELTLHYYARIPSIVDAPTPRAIDGAVETGLPVGANVALGNSNWLLAQYPNVYLYGLLAEAAAHMRDAEAAATYGRMLEMELDSVRSDDASARYGNTTIRFAGCAP